MMRGTSGSGARGKGAEQGAPSPTGDQPPDQESDEASVFSLPDRVNFSLFGQFSFLWPVSLHKKQRSDFSALTERSIASTFWLSLTWVSFISDWPTTNLSRAAIILALASAAADDAIEEPETAELA